jgi:CDP-6-deoxy-D-xylo-4-hexulose-3-dehydrase
MYWPLQENVITESDLETLVTFIRKTKRFTQFANVRSFETKFAEWQGCRYCVYVNSGSSANLILLNAAQEAFRWKAGDEVIVPAVTWTTTVTPVMQLGLTPVFVDVNLDDLAVDYEKVRQAITPRTRAIFVAHLLGFPAAIGQLQEIISGREIQILEDCCESQGAVLHGRKVGNHGLGGTFSFYWGHHMTTVEGGMVCTNNEDIYKLLLLKRSHGLARELPAEFHDELKAQHADIDFNFLFLTDGFNVRNTEFNAVLGLEQLKRIDAFIGIRNTNYEKFLNECSLYSKHLILVERAGRSSFVLPFFFRDQQLKVAFQDVIRSAGIESRPLISGNLLRQPFLVDKLKREYFPNAEFIHENAFYIGNNQFVDDNRLDTLFSLMEDFFSHL